MLIGASLLPCAFGCAGALYGAGACIADAALLLLAMRLHTSPNGSEAIAARRLFGFSILYLFLLFAGLLTDTVVLR